MAIMLAIMAIMAMVMVMVEMGDEAKINKKKHHHETNPAPAWPSPRSGLGRYAHEWLPARVV